MDDRELLDQQKAYYRARAPEYDEWFLRENRYDRGPEHRRLWFGEVEEVETVLRATVQGVDVLELACGTGLWTRRLAENNRRVVAIDASPEVIAINRARVETGDVEYIIADIFSWVPTTTFDAVFFSFWLSHVPPARFDAFWTLVRSALRPGGKAFFVDSLLEPTTSAVDHGPVDPSGVVHRRLNDGREFDVVKIFYEPADLERRLAGQGWRGWVRSTSRFFLYGCVSPENSQGTTSTPSTGLAKRGGESGAAVKVIADQPDPPHRRRPARTSYNQGRSHAVNRRAEK